MTPKIYIQVGVTALRTPTGKHYPAVPLYVEADKLNESGLAPVEEKMLTGFAGLLIEEYGKKIQAEKGVNGNENQGIV